MDPIYEQKTREEQIDLVYNLTLQNTNGRESYDEMYKLGIEACYDELINQWHKAAEPPREKNKPILIITKNYRTVLVGKYYKGKFYEMPQLGIIKTNNLQEVKDEIILWKYLEMPSSDLL